MLAALSPAVAAHLEVTAGRPPLASASADAHICARCLVHARSALLLDRLARERGELSRIERDVAERTAEKLSVVEQLDEQLAAETTPGQRLADAVARVGGSWPFVIGFFTFLVLWMAINVVLLGTRAYDPYPFILLNLVLSSIAAFQAPVIMMSQNRASVRDRLKADQDFRVNLKAELEIAALHEKLDHLLHARWESLLELQEAQMDLLEAIAERSGAAPTEAVPTPPPSAPRTPPT